jgi:hypothetical protein
MPAPEQGRTDSESSAEYLVPSIGRQHLTQPSRDATITCGIGEGYWRSSIGQAARGELSGLLALSVIRSGCVVQNAESKMLVQSMRTLAGSTEDMTKMNKTGTEGKGDFKATSELSGGVVDEGGDQLGDSKTCSQCEYTKPLVDFAKRVTSADGHEHVCRACMAVFYAKRRGKELHHLALTPKEAWEKAKTCTKCAVKKEIREFQRCLEGTQSWCRACQNQRSRAVQTSMSSPSQRCSRCGLQSPAETFWRDRQRPNGLYPICKSCNKNAGQLNRVMIKEAGMYILREDKFCFSCGKTKAVSAFGKDFASSDGLKLYCKTCHQIKYR